MFACVYRCEEIIENGLKSFFDEKEVYLPFFFVRLVRVSVHSGAVSCTFSSQISQMPLCFGTVGLVSCTIGFLVRLVILSVLLAYFYVQLVTHTVQMGRHPVQMEVIT